MIWDPTAIQVLWKYYTKIVHVAFMPLYFFPCPHCNGNRDKYLAWFN